MLRSLYSGVSGLRTHQTKMDVIGNNIANVNTTAFKASRVTFKDIYYQTISNASANTASKGGVNPKQIGNGVTVSSIDVINTRGNYQNTDRTLDLYLAGDGYFMMQDGTGMTSYTRVGNFRFDLQGGLVDANGNYVSGWQPYNTGDGVKAAPIIIEDIGNYTKIAIGGDGLITGVYSGQPPEQMPGTIETVGNFKDLAQLKGVSGGITYENGIIKSKDASGNINELYKDVKVNPDGSVTGTKIGTPDTPNTVIGNLITDLKVNPNDFQFDSYGFKPDGSIGALFKGHFTNGTESLVSLNGRFFGASGSYKDASFKDGKLTIKDGSGGADVVYENVKVDSNGKLTGDIPSGAKGQTISDIDISKNLADISQYTDIKLDANGNVVGKYTGEQYPEHVTDEIEVLGQIAVAKFTNPDGLSQQDGVYFQETKNSGKAFVTYPGDNGTATIVSGGLEMSNVDLSKEFTDMITTQRGFQANSRVITTSDEILQELVNLKR